MCIRQLLEKINEIDAYLCSLYRSLAFVFLVKHRDGYLYVIIYKCLNVFFL